MNQYGPNGIATKDLFDEFQQVFPPPPLMIILTQNTYTIRNLFVRVCVTNGYLKINWNAWAVADQKKLTLIEWGERYPPKLKGFEWVMVTTHVTYETRKANRFMTQFNVIYRNNLWRCKIAWRDIRHPNEVKYIQYNQCNESRTTDDLVAIVYI